MSRVCVAPLFLGVGALNIGPTAAGPAAPVPTALYSQPIRLTGLSREPSTSQGESLSRCGDSRGDENIL